MRCSKNSDNTHSNYSINTIKIHRNMIAVSEHNQNTQEYIKAQMKTVQFNSNAFFLSCKM